jgi:hypothetical protein
VVGVSIMPTSTTRRRYEAPEEQCDWGEYEEKAKEGPGGRGEQTSVSFVPIASTH